MGKNEAPKKLTVETDKLSKVGGGLGLGNIGRDLKSNVGDSQNCNNDQRSHDCNNTVSQGGQCITVSLDVKISK